MFAVLSFQSFSEYLFCCFLELCWSPVLGWELLTASQLLHSEQDKFSIVKVWVMREAVTVYVRRCLSRLKIRLKDCLCKISIFWIFLHHLKGVCCFKEKKGNSDLNAIPPLCSLLRDFIICTTQDWRHKILLLTTSLPKYTLFPAALVWNLSKDLTFLWKCSAYILFTGLAKNLTA